jgi:hypothetical protein
MSTTLRWRMMAATAAAVLGWIGLTPATASAASISLLVPQSTAFAVLGHWCGGIREKAYASQFDASSGYPDGNVFLSTSCSTGGRGGHSTTYSAWVATTWDFTGALVSYTTLQQTPPVNPTLSVFDSYGNQLYNQTNLAYLALAPGFVPAPRVAGVSPASAPQGSTVTITGTGFTGAGAVSFGPDAASFTVNSDTSITAIVPAELSGTVDVTVTNSGGTSAVNTSDQFTFVPTPRVSSISPNQGSADGGTSITITGVNFTSATGVAFGGISVAFTVSSDTSIVAVSPPASDSGITVDVTVTSPDGTSAITDSDRFTYSD